MTAERTGEEARWAGKETGSGPSSATNQPDGFA